MDYKKINFIPTTLKFAIAGIFIPGFTAIIIIGLQMAIAYLGVECSKSWGIIWIISGIGSLVTPLYFNNYLIKLIESGQSISNNSITTFNIIEYVFLQSILVLYFTDGKTLCYVSDGQNGMGFVITGWMALPILVGFSLFFNYLVQQNKIK